MKTFGEITCNLSISPRDSSTASLPVQRGKQEMPIPILSNSQRKAERETDRKRDRRKERPTNRETDRETERETEREADRETDRVTDRQRQSCDLLL